MEDSDPIEMPVDGVLDLHAFRPAEVKDVVTAYIEACREKGIRDLRIIHGKGIGTLQRQVHALLARDPRVESFRLASGDAGGWGATLARLVKE
ncbi:MAG: Smr/MutS family protein [Oceanipulchritudo sp.]